MWKVTRCLDLLSESPHRLGPARDDPYVTQCRWIAGPSFFSLCAAADRLLALVFRSVGDATKDQTSQGPRVFIRSKATCAAPLCEVLTPCRGLRPHHVQRDRIGSWEVSGLAVSVA